MRFFLVNCCFAAILKYTPQKPSVSEILTVHRSYAITIRRRLNAGIKGSFGGKTSGNRDQNGIRDGSASQLSLGHLQSGRLCNGLRIG